MTRRYSLYCSYHRPFLVVDVDGVYPIHVGRTLTLDTFLPLCDDVGDNISYKNGYYCELTAQYWVWKNRCDSDYIGFMHYRRHLNLSLERQMACDTNGQVSFDEIGPDYLDAIGLDADNLLRIFSEGDIDIILPESWDTRNIGASSNYDLYRKSRKLHASDYDAAMKVLVDLYPEYAESVEQYNNSPFGYYTNMFVMKRELFRCYSAWLFSVLDAYEQVASFGQYDREERRAIAHIAERLLGIYVTRLSTENPSLSILEVNRTHVTNTGVQYDIRPARARVVPVVICFDDDFCLPACALLQSVIANSSEAVSYDIVIFGERLSVSTKRRLLALVEGRENFSVRFVPLHEQSLMYQHTRGHFSTSTYARLFIPDIMCDYEKVIFLDTDIIVETDIAELMSVDLGDNLIAAVKDIIIEGFVGQGTPSDSSTGGLPAADYLSDYLGLSDINSYFQAGVLVFNIERMNEEGTYRKFMEVMQRKKYWFVDQDIMNIVLEGRVCYLDLSWNVVHGNGNTDDFFPALRFSTFMRYMESRQEPKIIHFAGDQKPWVNHRVDFADNYFKYLGQTPWQHAPANATSSGEVTATSALSRRSRSAIIRTVKKLAPPGTSRRALAYKVYNLFR